MVGIIMGSLSDWKVMSAAVEILEQFGIPYEKEVVSAHRTPITGKVVLDETIPGK